MRFVRATDTADAVLTAAAETGHSRFPVSGEDSDDVIGLVHLKRAVAIPPDERAGVRVDQLMVAGADRARAAFRSTTCSTSSARRACRWPWSPTNTAEPPAFSRSRTWSRSWSARSPTSTTRRATRAELLPDGTWLLPGTLRPDEIAEITDVLLPESGAYETVAGLLIARLGRMPENFDSVEVEATIGARTSLGVARDGAGGHADDRPIDLHLLDDLPRAVTVRLTVHRRARRRIDTVRLSAVGLDGCDAGGQPR